jgi:hypothetical protein
MAIERSRSAIAFLRRSGAKYTPRVPAPRLAIPNLHLHDIPLTARQLDPNLMIDADGDPPSDRGRIDNFPPPQQVQ